MSKGRTVRDDAVIELATTIVDTLPGANGPLNVQIFKDADSGELNVIEINPRFGGGFPLAWRAGARFPQWLVEDAAAIPSSSASGHEWEDGLTMLRYDEAVYVRSDGTMAGPDDV